MGTIGTADERDLQVRTTICIISPAEKHQDYLYLYVYIYIEIFIYIYYYLYYIYIFF